MTFKLSIYNYISPQNLKKLYILKVAKHFVFPKTNVLYCMSYIGPDQKQFHLSKSN